MDNAAEALFMGAAVLVFMVAVSLTLSSFSTFRNDLEDIILADERVDAAQDSSGNYINYISSENECRVVGIDTLVNSLYRVYKENYIVVIKLNNGYEEFNSTGILKDYPRCCVSGNTMVKEQNYPDKTQPTGLRTIISQDEKILVFAIPTFGNNKKYAEDILKDGLYNLLKDKAFTEYTGVYYVNDAVDLGTDPDSLSTDENDPKFKISVANKTRARIITYIEK